MKHSLYSALIVFLVTVFGFISCANSEAPVSQMSFGDHDEKDAMAEPAPESMAALPGKPKAAPQAKRMIIRTGNISLVDDHPEKVSAAIQTLATEVGGFVVTSGTRGGSVISSASLTIRVPAKKFDSTMSAIREQAEVASESVKGEDVTAEFVDLGARLTTQRNLEARFQALLLTATSVEDTIKVETELARVRTEIERMQGRRNQIENQARLATIQITIDRDARTEGAMADIEDAFNDAGSIMGSVVAGLIRVTAGLIPIVLILGTFVFILITILKRRKKKKSES